MIKESIIMFLSNLTLVPMQKHQNYKNMDKIKALLIKLPYDKVIWLTKSLNICSVITDVAPKNISYTI